MRIVRDAPENLSAVRGYIFFDMSDLASMFNVRREKMGLLYMARIRGPGLIIELPGGSQSVKPAECT